MLKFKKTVRLTTNNQVAIPSVIVRELGLQKGAILEVEEKGKCILMTPKKLVDAEDFSMYESMIRRGRREQERGQTTDWETVKKKLSFKRRKKS